MDIALVTSEYPRSGVGVGGLGSYTARIASMLGANGHRVVVAALDSVSDVSESGPVVVIRVPRRRPLGQLRKIRFFWRYEAPLRRFLDSHRLLRALRTVESRRAVDVVHLASYQSPGVAIARARRWPTISRFSSLDWLWRQAMNETADASDRLLDRLERMQAEASTITCCPSEFLARKVTTSYGLASRIVRTPPPPVPEPDDRPGRDSPMTLSFVGAGNRVKGFDLFLDAAVRLLENGVAVRFEIAARMSDQSPHHAALSTLLEKFTGYVVFHGEIDADRVYDIYHRASCVVIPSRVDNYPNVCLEAQGCGCPIVASRNSSLDEMVMHGVNGLLFENSSVDDLVGAIRTFLDLPGNEYSRMRFEAQRADVARRREQPLKQLVSLYEEARSHFPRETGSRSRHSATSAL